MPGSRCCHRATPVIVGEIIARAVERRRLRRPARRSDCDPAAHRVGGAVPADRRSRAASGARHRLNTSVLEGMNNRIKVIKRMAYGWGAVGRSARSCSTMSGAIARRTAPGRRTERGYFGCLTRSGLDRLAALVSTTFEAVEAIDNPQQ
ncbi:transposase [Modicisalibacter zincidurans]|uniref:transposase n=1 Tax=Modicisalibacter zincidurans TaxID=1178777 RepID=UPI003BF60B78